MDMQHILREAERNYRNPLPGLWNYFLSKKVESVYNQFCKNDSPWIMKDLPRYFQEIYPDAEVIAIPNNRILDIQHYDGEQWTYLILSNAVFENTSSRGGSLFYHTKWMRSAKNVGYIKCINDTLPLWKEEFKNWCKDHKAVLRKLEQKRLRHWANDTHFDLASCFLKEKMQNFLLLERFTPDYAERILRNLAPVANRPYASLLNDISIPLSNIRIVIRGRDDRPYSSASIHFQDFVFKFGWEDHKDLSLERLYELDHQLPTWKKESETLHFEVKKMEKIEQIGHNAMLVLTRQRMRELQLEYNIEESHENGNITLMVKLEKRRALKVTLQNGHTEWVKRQLDDLSQIVTTINTIPSNVRICSQPTKAQWRKENSE